MSKQPTAAPDDPLGRLLEIAARMDENIRRLTDEIARFVAAYEADKAIEDARQRAIGLQAPHRYLSHQQPRLDGDHEPWAPHK